MTSVWVRAACALWIGCVWTGCADDGRQQLARALIGRGRLALVGELQVSDFAPKGVAGTELVQGSSLPPIAAALAGSDASTLCSALTDAGLSGLLVAAATHAAPLRAPAAAKASLREQLAHYAHVDGLQGVFLSRSVALYTLDPLRSWSPALRAGLAQVARRLVGGAAPPRLSSFPEPVRRLEPVEVMVLLRSGDRPRLWRSARGSSFARALLTAASVARQRWIERANALGGRLGDVLPTLSVELSLLQDDGELGTRSDAFVDQAVLSEHGVGYEYKGNWHYLLPEVAHDQGREPSRAFKQLFQEDGLPEDSLKHPEVRPYRVAVQRIGVSEPQPSAQTSPPDEVEGF